jgi:hypothetical protein
MLKRKNELKQRVKFLESENKRLQNTLKSENGLSRTTNKTSGKSLPAILNFVIIVVLISSMVRDTMKTQMFALTHLSKCVMTS